MQGFFEHQPGTIDRCPICKLHRTAQSAKMEPSGLFRKKIMIVAEAPTKAADKRGQPMAGLALQILKNRLAKQDIDLHKDCMLLNAVNCCTQTPAGKERAPTNKEIYYCQSRVHTAIRKHKPRVVLLLGSAALKSILLERWKKDLGSIDKWRGYTIPDQDLRTWICPMWHPNYLTVREGFAEVETIWQQDLQRALQVAEKQVPVYDVNAAQYHYITDTLEAVKAIKHIIRNHKRIVFDLETTGLKPYDKKKHHIGLISIATGPDNVYCIKLPETSAMPQNLQKALKWLLTSQRIKKIAHNMTYEQMWVKQLWGYDVTPWDVCTMQAAHVLDNRTGITGLKFQTYARFGIVDYASAVEKYLKSPDSNTPNKLFTAMQDIGALKQLMRYCAKDSLFTWWLMEEQTMELLDTHIQKGYDLIHHGTLALSEASNNGMRVDLQYMQQMETQLETKIEHLKNKFTNSELGQKWQNKYAHNTNYQSSTQLGEMLYGELGLKPPKQTATGKGSTDEESLQQLNLPELNLLLRARKMQKIKDTYLANFQKEQTNGWLHPNFNLHTVITYRSSSANPNFQNIPKRDKQAMQITRRCIKARPGHQLLEVDFSKLEVSIAACYHKDPQMLKYLTSDKNDMHGDLAQQIFMLKEFDKHRPDHALLRNAAKNGFVFPQFYGDYYANNAESLRQWCKLPTKRWKKGQGEPLNDAHVSDHMIANGISSMMQFTEHLKKIEHDFWHNRFREYGRWKKRFIKEYQKNGYIEMFTGFRCRGEMRQNAVINYPVQGAAFHCLLWTFIEVNKALKKHNYSTRLIGQIHDAIVLDAHPDELIEAARLIKKIALVQLPATWQWINVPLQIEAELCPVDGSWADKQDWKEFADI